MPGVKALANLRICTDLPEPALRADTIRVLAYIYFSRKCPNHRSQPSYETRRMKHKTVRQSTNLGVSSMQRVLMTDFNAIKQAGFNIRISHPHTHSAHTLLVIFLLLYLDLTIYFTCVHIMQQYIKLSFCFISVHMETKTWEC